MKKGDGIGDLKVSTTAHRLAFSTLSVYRGNPAAWSASRVEGKLAISATVNPLGLASIARMTRHCRANCLPCIGSSRKVAKDAKINAENEEVLL
jgi:hypothetical protein